MPFDVVRKRLQVQGPVRNIISVVDVPKNTRFLQTAANIIKHEGIFGLYRGLVPAILKAAPSSALTFFIVNQCNDFFKSLK